MSIDPLSPAEQAELRRLNRQFISDLERVVRGPVGCMRSDEEIEGEVEQIVMAILDGAGIAADRAAVELAAELKVLPKPWISTAKGSGT